MSTTRRSPTRATGSRLDLLFDLDGTLTDPGVGITRCLTHALERLGLAPPAERELRRFVGPPLWRTFRELLSTDDEPRVAEAVQLYRERFSTVGLFENVLYPDVPGGLATLRQQGHRLFLATSKPHVFARRVLEHFGLDALFAGVYGSELSGANSDKGDLIQALVAQEALEPDRACMIGDRALDVEGARRNGLRAVAVRWGYGSEEELMQARPDAMVASMAELCVYLDRAASLSPASGLPSA
jgi:phosphoglycolate phosphatase